MITTREQRLLNFFNNLYEKTLEPSTFSLSQYCKDNCVHTQIGSIAVKNKLLIVDASSKNRTYTWNTIKPNIKTIRKVDEIFKAMNKVNNEKHRKVLQPKVEEVAEPTKEVTTPVEEIPVKTIKPKTKTVVKTIVVEEKKVFKEFNLLWGLLRFKW